MPYPDSLLAADETVVLHKHPHWKTLIAPAFSVVAIVAGAIVLWTLFVIRQPDEGLTTHRYWLWGSLAVGALLLLWLCLVPIIRRRCEHFVLTNEHVFYRRGVLSRQGHQIPLHRVQDIETVTTFAGRLLGYGTLIVDSAADQPLRFTHVAELAKVQRTLNELVAKIRGSAPAGAETAQPQSSTALTDLGPAESS